MGAEANAPPSVRTTTNPLTATGTLLQDCAPTRSSEPDDRVVAPEQLQHYPGPGRDPTTFSDLPPYPLSLKNSSLYLRYPRLQGCVVAGWAAGVTDRAAAQRQ